MRARLTYYTRRSIAEVAPEASTLGDLDYVVLARRDIDGVVSSDEPDSRPPRELELGNYRVQVVAEFGSWILARIEPS